MFVQRGYGMKYFMDCKNESDLKEKYRTLAKANHPDLGGSEAIMKEINAEYEKAINMAWRDEGEDKAWKTHETPKEWMAMMMDLIRLEGVFLEVCGSWIWATGNTKPHAEAFRNHNFSWSKPKSAWFWKPYKSKGFSRGRFTLDEIRTMHGSTKMEGERQERLESAR